MKFLRSWSDGKYKIYGSIQRSIFTVHSLRNI